jgi:hypothetical protein
MLAAFVFGVWLTSLAFPIDQEVAAIRARLASEWRRAIVAAQVAAAALLLFAVFSFGMWITAPPFPFGRELVAISLNGQPIILDRPGVRWPTLMVGPRRPFWSNAAGQGYCGLWMNEVIVAPLYFIHFSGEERFHAAASCGAHEFESRYLRALLGATRWRTKGGYLILENGTDVLRFVLAR